MYYYKGKTTSDCKTITTPASTDVVDEYLGISFKVRPKGDEPRVTSPSENALIAGNSKRWCVVSQENRSGMLKVRVRILAHEDSCLTPPDNSFFLREFNLTKSDSGEFELARVCILPNNLCVAAGKLTPLGLHNANWMLKGVVNKLDDQSEELKIVFRF